LFQHSQSCWLNYHGLLFACYSKSDILRCEYSCRVQLLAVHELTVLVCSRFLYRLQKYSCTNHKTTVSLLHIVHLTYEVFSIGFTSPLTRNLMTQRCSTLGVRRSDAISC
jgi:hypothetical protein